MDTENPMKLQNTVSKDAFRYGYLLKRIYPYIKKVMFRAILGIIIAIPLGLLDGVTALALKPYLDYVVNGNSAATFKILGYSFHTQLFWELLIPPAIVLFAIFQGGLKYANNYLTDWTGIKMANSIKIDLFKKLTSLSPKFYDINTSGIVLTRFLSDPETASRSIIDNVKTFVSTIFGIVGLVGVLLYTAWKLAIIGVTVLAIAMLPVALIRKKVKSVSNATMVVGGGMTTNFNETFAGNKIVTAYNLKNDRDKLFEEQIHEQFNLAMSLTKRVGWLSPIMYLIASIGIAVVMAYGNHLIVSGELSSGSFAAFVTSLLLLYKPVKGLGQTLANLQNTFVAMSRTFELFDLVPEVNSPSDGILLSTINNGVEFKNVYFEYEKDEPVLKGINLTVQKGETLALVGNSGGGKSTIVNLIPRFYDVTSGSIKFDGQQMSSYL